MCILIDMKKNKNHRNIVNARINSKKVTDRAVPKCFLVLRYWAISLSSIFRYSFVPIQLRRMIRQRLPSWSVYSSLCQRLACLWSREHLRNSKSVKDGLQLGQLSHWSDVKTSTQWYYRGRLTILTSNISLLLISRLLVRYRLSSWSLPSSRSSQSEGHPSPLLGSLPRVSLSDCLSSAAVFSPRGTSAG